MKPGATICSATQTVVPWSVLPAQVVYCNESAAEFGPGDKGARGRGSAPAWLQAGTLLCS